MDDGRRRRQFGLANDLGGAMISDIPSFIGYFDGVRRRTGNYLRTLPPDRIDWAPRAGEFTCGDLIRHLAAGEQMFVGTVVNARWAYPGHAGTPGDTLAGLLTALEQGHATAMAQLRGLPDSVLREPRPTLDGPPLKAWRLLMAMVEHEIHHRSQLAMYLTLLGVTPPHIYGLGVEDVIARATG